MLRLFFFFAMASSQTKGRALIPSELTVAELEERFEAYLTKTGSRDMTTLTQLMKKETTWKSAPRASVMAHYAPLYEELVDMSPSGMLPPKKTQLALMACHKRNPINFSGRDNGLWSDEIGGLVRACFGKFRSVGSDAEAHRRCFSKAPISTCT